ncbi:MAG: hypothetical protein FWG73_02290 [Planctomycetaceae bacterium]|nr:hypothetical protein [Planctomycetaceae bacterium]
MSKFFDFINRLFDQDSISSTSHDKSKRKRHRNRTARLEELEDREMLSVSPWALADDFADTSQPSTHDAVVVNTFMPEGSPQATGASSNS